MLNSAGVLRQLVGCRCSADVTLSYQPRDLVFYAIDEACAFINTVHRLMWQVPLISIVCRHCWANTPLVSK
ncbi:unnamed protein product [Lathyrus sativus]|nr:unnamed protein product [Lathyrus sativus]